MITTVGKIIAHVRRWVLDTRLLYLGREDGYLTEPLSLPRESQGSLAQLSSELLILRSREEFRECAPSAPAFAGTYGWIGRRDDGIRLGGGTSGVPPDSGPDFSRRDAGVALDKLWE